jgi:hypothetical protein
LFFSLSKSSLSSFNDFVHSIREPLPDHETGIVSLRPIATELLRTLQIHINKANGLPESLLSTDTGQLTHSVFQMEVDIPNTLRQFAIQPPIASEIHQKFNKLQLDETTIEQTGTN